MDLGKIKLCHACHNRPRLRKNCPVCGGKGWLEQNDNHNLQRKVNTSIKK